MNGKTGATFLLVAIIVLVIYILFCILKSMIDKSRYKTVRIDDDTLIKYRFHSIDATKCLELVLYLELIIPTKLRLDTTHISDRVKGFYQNDKDTCLVQYISYPSTRELFKIITPGGVDSYQELYQCLYIDHNLNLKSLYDNFIWKEGKLTDDNVEYVVKGLLNSNLHDMIIKSHDDTVQSKPVVEKHIVDECTDTTTTEDCAPPRPIVGLF